MSDETNIIFEPAPTTHWRNLHPNKCLLLGTQNLNKGEELVAIIKKIDLNMTVKGRNGKEDTVPVMYFENIPQPMVISAIENTKVLRSLYGDYYEDWIGKPIQLYVKDGVKDFGGGKTSALRIRGFVPDIGGDISEYEDAIKNAKSLEELQKAYLSAPKNVQPKLKRLTNVRKGELSE